MPKATKPEQPKDTRTQRQKFIDAAREVGAEDNDQQFEQKLRALAKAATKKGEPKQ